MSQTLQPARKVIPGTPWLGPGMGVEAAALSGYRHGYEQHNSTDICTLTEGTQERQEWLLGYFRGERDRFAECDHVEMVEREGDSDFAWQCAHCAYVYGES